MNTPEILYHYTDAKGLHGILDSKKIFASSFRFMSDAHEFYYGFDLISEIFPEETPIQALSLDFSGSSAYSNFGKLIKWFKNHYDLDVLFIASFSAKNNGDLLSQWRGYGGLHSGYSLGFSTEALRSVNPEIKLIECCYNKSNQLKKIVELIEKHFSAAKIETASSNHDPNYLHGCHVVEAAQEMALLSASLKHSAFEEENEWRLVMGPLVFNDKRICYRAVERAVIPYVEIDFNANGLPLQRIIVGPGPHKERNVKSLHQRLKAQGYKEVEVIPSKVPFRTW